MSMRWPTCLGAALVACAAFVYLADAKPPDLPRQDNVNCKENDPASPPREPVAGDEDAEPVSAEAAEAEQPIDVVCPWFANVMLSCDVLNIPFLPCWQKRAHGCPCAAVFRGCRDSIRTTMRMCLKEFHASASAEDSGAGEASSPNDTAEKIPAPKEVQVPDENDAVPPPPPPEESVLQTPEPIPAPHEVKVPELIPEPQEDGPQGAATCPYLIEKQRTPRTCAHSNLADSPLENLERLEMARDVCKFADRLQGQGKIEDAKFWYEQVRELVPGSRFDQHARLALDSIAAKSSKTAPAEEASDADKPNQADESEEPPMAEPDLSEAESVEEEVEVLLGACQRAMTDGHYRQAEHLAKLALERDAECVAANTLVYKMHLLVQLEEKKAARQKHRSAKPTSLRPHMPAVDPNIVVDFERVLDDRNSSSEEAETPDCCTPK